MTDERWLRLRDLFARVRDLPDAERAAWLDRELGGDAGLRAELERLLRADGSAERFLAPKDNPAPHGIVGPYRLVRILGEGGFGVVWLAEQDEPIRRRVALKLIKPGMDSASVVARFEAERQALASMDHPGIAQVFEAGATASGRPYFAMEYVEGAPVTTFCDAESLPLRERLHVFTAVCDAVQHAHQRGVIHRDLKPSNILVARRDGVPAPKVIDFGVVKATSPAAEAALLTREGTIVGTAGYMSPEQAGATGAPVDTRSDVYALGVVLYELLTGVLPFDPQRLATSNLSEALRIVREEDPPPPATRLSRAGDALATAAARRSTEPRRLLRDLTGELQWITARALEKDPERRYASAAELAADIRRHLADEPVLAAAPDTGYRVRKLVRRHRVGVTAAALVLAAIVAGGIAAGAGMGRAVRAEHAARLEAESSRRVAEFLVELFRASSPSRARGEVVTARTLLDEGARRIESGLDEDPRVRARLLDALASSYQGLGEYEEGVRLAERALEAARAAEPRPGLEVARRLYSLAHALSTVARDDSVPALVDRAIALAQASGEPDVRLIADCLSRKGLWWSARGEGARAESLVACAIEAAGSVPEPDPSQLMRFHSTAGYLANMRFDLEQAERHFRRSLELAEQADEPTWVEASHARLATVCQGLGQGDRALAHAEEGLRIARRIYPPDSPHLAGALAGRIAVLAGQGRGEEAIESAEEALGIERAAGTPGGLAFALNTLSNLYLGTGRVEPSIALSEEACRVSVAAWGADKLRSAEAMALLAYGYAAARRGREADSTFRAAIDVFDRLGEGGIFALEAFRGYANFCRDGGRLDRADSLYARTEAAVDTTNGSLRAFLGTLRMERGDLRSLQGRHADAEALLQTALALQSEGVAEDDPGLGAVHLTWAAARARAGRADGAVEQLARAAACGATAEDAESYPELAALRSRPDYPWANSP